MRRHLRRWLNDAELERRGGRFDGVIAAVTEETVRNRFTAQRELQPVIAFDDGWRLVPNLTMRRALIEMFGTESNAWIGRRVTIHRQRVERIDKITGAIRESFQKTVSSSDVAPGTTIADYDDRSARGRDDRAHEGRLAVSVITTWTSPKANTTRRAITSTSNNTNTNAKGNTNTKSKGEGKDKGKERDKRKDNGNDKDERAGLKGDPR